MRSITKNIIILEKMEYRLMLHFQRCLYFHVLLFIIWLVVEALLLYVKIDNLGHLSKYLSFTVYTLLFFVDFTRLYLGQYGNLSSRVPELAGFLMLTILMQLPLVAFFLFNPFLLTTVVEYTLHIILWTMTLLEVILGFMALKQASSVAKSIYLSHPRHR